jgi:hypothetical protein
VVTPLTPLGLLVAPWNVYISVATEKYVDHFANFSLNKETPIIYSPISDSSVAAAKAKFAAFFKKSEKYKL